ncbi:MAG: tetratricopeptide repeat protein, partial [Porticoccaceae bacterium]|nr:tetratricopeptide repeat protein [Porticoccaceae bacterium]
MTNKAVTPLCALFLMATCHASLADKSYAAGDNMIEKIVGKDGLMSPRKVLDGCADDLNREALRIAKAADEDFWVMGKTRDAAIRLEKAITLEPRLYFAYSNLKFHYCWALKQCDRAIAILEEGISHCPNWAGHNEDLGAVYSEMGEHNLALEEYAKAQAKGVTQSASFYYNLGSTNGRLKRYDEAIANFRKAIDMDETHFNAHKNLIVTFAMQHENQKALKQVEILLSLDPDEELKTWTNG